MTLPVLNRVYVADALTQLRQWPNAFVDAVVTSPPYYQQHVYGRESQQLGWEWTPDAHVAALAPVLAELKRVLKPDGTIWLNLADTYRKKSLLGIPARVEEELRQGGWRIRNRIIWTKPNPKPHGRLDRFNESHEYVLLASKAARYFFDREAARSIAQSQADVWSITPVNRHRLELPPALVVRVTPYPDELCRRAIICATRPGGLVLDPFMGSGTTALAADRLGRTFLGIELAGEFAELSMRRVAWDRARRASATDQVLPERSRRVTPEPDANRPPSGATSSLEDAA
jgi:site-specific DNA-methyltransferase (adenine-specific)